MNVMEALDKKEPKDEKDKDLSLILIKNIDVGALGSFEWNPDIERVGMMKSLSDIVVFPILHNNTNKFMGMNVTKDDFLCHRVIKDKVHALTSKGNIHTWDFITGKYIKNEHGTDQSLTEYYKVV